MLLSYIGFMIIGYIQLDRGNKLLAQAQACQDADEQAALQALGAKRRRYGKMIMIGATAVLLSVFLFFSILIARI